MSNKKLIEIEHHITRIRDRIRDVEWQISQCSDEARKQELNAERHRAMDKLRHLQDDQLAEKVNNIGEANA